MVNFMAGIWDFIRGLGGYELFGNLTRDYMVAAVIILAGVFLIRLLRVLLRGRFHVWAERTSTNLDNFLVHADRRVIPLLYIGVIFIALSFINIALPWRNAINVAGLIVTTIFSVLFLLSLLSYVFERYWAARSKENTNRHALNGILTAVKALVWILAAIVLLDNLGVKVSALVAGLGIGGIAVALAAQAILGDFFSYVTIFLDRPFEIGDFVIVGEFMGTVEYIGLKTTRIRSLGGEQLVFSNTDLTNSRVRNYKRMQRRRVVFRIGVCYETNHEQLKAIPGVIKGIIEGIHGTVFDRVHFAEFGDFSLVYEIVYYVDDSDYNRYMDIQQEINLAIKEQLESRGIGFAYPTQTLYIAKTE